MNGMQYLQKTFTLPASSGKSTSAIKWDLAFLTPEEFEKKYPGANYARIADGRSIS